MVFRVEIVKHLVSTVIPVRNRPQMLREAVGSVLAQTYRAIEIVIVDDGSTDDTLDVARSLANAHPGVVHVVELPHSGRGPGPVREAGRVSARGEYIQYLDSDDLLLPEKFALQVAALQQHPECEIAYGWTRYRRADGSTENIPYKWTGKVFEHLFPALLVDRWWCTVTPLYRRTLTDRVGCWDDLRWGQDWAYDARCASYEPRLAFVPAFVGEFREHRGIRQTSPANEHDPVRLSCYLRLQEIIHESAARAGIKPGSPESAHFSRVAFMLTRGLAAFGLSAEAERSFDLARKSAGPALANGRDFAICGWMSRNLGWYLTGNLLRLRDLAPFRRHGPHTQPWSWAMPETMHSDGPPSSATK